MLFHVLDGLLAFDTPLPKFQSKVVAPSERFVICGVKGEQPLDAEKSKSALGKGLTYMSMVSRAKQPYRDSLRRVTVYV